MRGFGSSSKYEGAGVELHARYEYQGLALCLRSSLVQWVPCYIAVFLSHSDREGPYVDFRALQSN